MFKCENQRRINASECMAIKLPTQSQSQLFLLISENIRGKGICTTLCQSYFLIYLNYSNNTLLKCAAPYFKYYFRSGGFPSVYPEQIQTQQKVQKMDELDSDGQYRTGHTGSAQTGKGNYNLEQRNLHSKSTLNIPRTGHLCQKQTMMGSFIIRPKPNRYAISCLKLRTNCNCILETEG